MEVQAVQLTEIRPRNSDEPDINNEYSREAQRGMTKYLLERCEDFQKLHDLREQGWKSTEGNEHFRIQRQKADEPTNKDEKYFYKMMLKVGSEMDKITKALRINSSVNGKPRILDMGVAPGGFLSTALGLNPTAEAVGFTLPVSMGGFKVSMPESDRVRMTYVDITMLAGDMGLSAGDISSNHPDHNNFVLERQLPAPLSDEQDSLFDLAFCGGSVLRTHRRAEYREAREAGRLIAAQLALALGRLRPGGTMVVLLHKADSWPSAQLMHTCSRFAAVRLFKPRSAHVNRSSFYMVATRVQSRHAEALAAVQRWERLWKVATFGTDEEYGAALCEDEPEVKKVLDEFGSRLIKLGTPVWRIQAQALAKAPWMKQQQLVQRYF